MVSVLSSAKLLPQGKFKLVQNDHMLKLINQTFIGKYSFLQFPHIHLLHICMMITCLVFYYIQYFRSIFSGRLMYFRSIFGGRHLDTKMLVPPVCTIPIIVNTDTLVLIKVSLCFLSHSWRIVMFYTAKRVMLS